MNRDWNIIRDILLRVESSTSPLNAGVSVSSFPKDQMNEYYYNLNLICESQSPKLVLYTNDIGQGGIKFFTIQNLTIEGHDLLDTLKSKPLWEQIISLAKSRSLELTFDTIKAMAPAAAQNIFSSV